METMQAPLETRVNIYVINLEKRIDRLRRIESALRAKGLEFTRIDAVDGLVEKAISGGSSFLSAGLICNWLSHQKALATFVESSAEYALILEDDAEVSKSRISSQHITVWIQAMILSNLSLLQVGFISHLYSLLKPRGFLDFVLAIRGKRIVWGGKNGSGVVLSEFRAGAHAYLVDKKMAHELIGANIPTLLASDNFLESLAQHDSLVRFGRLFTSTVEQESRVHKKQISDSDVC